MSKLKTPPEKKRAAYEHDHRTAMEAPHAFRKNWPKKKARINRNRRRTAEWATAAVVKGADPEAVIVPTRRPGEHIHKSGVGPLKEAVAYKLRRLRTAFLPHYTCMHYSPAEYRQEFVAFLQALVRGRSDLARTRASQLLWLMDARLPNNSSVLDTRRWLEQFFALEPAWEQRVRQWCARLAAPERRRRTTRCT